MYCDFKVANPKQFIPYLRYGFKKKRVELKVELGKSDVSCFSGLLDYARLTGYTWYTTR